MGVRAIQQVRDMAREVCRDARGSGAQVELGGCERALHRNVLGACCHHPGEQGEQGRGIAGSGEHFCLSHQLLEHVGRDGEIQRFLGREVPVDGSGADARPAGDLVERDAKAVRREHLLRGPQDLLAIVARVSPQLAVTPVSCRRLGRSGLVRLA